jgi:hypothetical protein
MKKVWLHRLLECQAGLLVCVFAFVLVFSSVCYAVNDVEITELVNFDFDTADTSSFTSVLGQPLGINTEINLEPNYMEVSMDNTSTITLNTTNAGEYFKITKLSGSNDYTISPTCYSTQVQFDGTGANVIFKVEVITTAPSCGGSSPIFPSAYALSINNGASCTTSGTVNLNLVATDATEVIVSNSNNFEGASWESFNGTMTKSWPLTLGAGNKTVYAIFRSSTGDVTPIISTGITMNSSCGSSGGTPPVVIPPVVTPPVVTPPTEPPTLPPGAIPGDLVNECVFDCKNLEYDLYLINPNLSERHMGSRYVKEQKISDGIYQYSFEDSGTDFDYNDVVIRVDKRDCQKMSFSLVGLDAAWHHQVRLKLLSGGIEKENIQIAADTQLFTKSQPVVVDALSMRNNLCLNQLVYVTPDGKTTTNYIIVYDQPEFKGNSEIFSAGTQIPDLRETKIGQDTISSVSIKVYGSTRAELFQHINYLGIMETVSKSDGNLTDNVIGDNQVSSLKVFATDGKVSSPSELGDCAKSLVFTRNLSFGSSGAEVRALQDLLQCLGYFPMTVAKVDNFGPTTQSSVRKFQTAHGISPVGNVGPLTRAALNKY